MSASREKQLRQEQTSSGWTDPKTAREAQQRKEARRSNILYGVIGVVFAAAVIVSLVWHSNILQKTATAATIDGEKYTAGEVTYYYQNVYRTFLNNYYYYVSYLGLDTSVSLDSQTIDETAAALLGIELEEDETKTWKDYFLETALDQMATIQAGLKAADAEGYVYPDSVQTQYDSSMASLKSVAAASNLTVNQYLQTNLGSAITEKVYGAQLLRTLKFSAYATAYQDSLTYDDATLDETYAADTNSYDKVAYEYVSISGAAESTTDADGNTVDPTDEESAAALEAAETAANEMLAAYQAGSSLETLAEADDSYSYTNLDAGSYASSTLTDWAFDSARKTGDSAVLESGTTYYVVVFHDRYREEYNTVNVRHILVNVNEDDLDSESDTYEADLQARQDEAKAEAESILAEWQSGEATEDSFAALANEKSEDAGSNTSGGLYTQVYKNQMVTEFNDWCFDSARKTGDTGIVYNENTGYHVMYFVGTDIPYWQVQVISDLKTEDFNTWYDALSEGMDIQQNESGIKYVG
jgi:parvulin-like peptidyl-prolyl isomerase